MDDWKTRIKTLLDEFEFTHLYRTWPERLIAAGIDKDKAHIWATEIGQVVDEFRSRLIELADVLEETDIERIPQQIASWAVGISVITVEEIQEPMRYLLENHLPPEPDDEDEAT